jgi:(1->4)-alpha-D-glucan 1-alpha-D-glucosylmutase
VRVPLATYRIQFNRNFPFESVRALVPYLHSLGITDLYASPLLKARSGSLHCYDTTDPTRLNQELGTEEDFEALFRDLKSHGMGLLLDIVPNHMAANSENPWWSDVLENGPASAYASFFDINWHPVNSHLENQVLLPILGDSYGHVLENQELGIALDDEGFSIRYYEHRLPLNVKTYKSVLTYRLEDPEGMSGASQLARDSVVELIEAVDRLPVREFPEQVMASKRTNAVKAIKERLWNLYNTHPEIKVFIDENIRVFNGTKGDVGSFALLDRLYAQQYFRLTFWRRAADSINYRRFFDVNDLVSIRVEDPKVFEVTHELIKKLVREEKVTGLRVDHIDGLYDPLDYLRRLQDHLAPEVSHGEEGPGFYVAVEKVLVGNETLPEDWPVCGTTGYEFLNTTNGVFVYPDGLGALASIYAKFTGFEKSFADICHSRKKLVMEQLFLGEVQSLTDHLHHLAEQDRHAHDLALHELFRALVEVTACLPIYRTYIRSFEVSARDNFYIERALQAARLWAPKELVSPQTFAFLRRVLLLDPPPYAEDQKGRWLEFVRRWQQLTGPVKAKGLEDTALYMYNRLISLKEVGSDPHRADSPVDIETFHHRNQIKLQNWPYSLNTSSTHDTKRSEGVRARINVLSEIPQTWKRRLDRWSRWNRPKKQEVDDHLMPESNTEILIYQTMIGAWPLYAEQEPDFRDRLKEYIIKAAREAKVYTSWIRPNHGYETAILSFVDAILEPSGGNEFLADFLRFQMRVAFYGAFNSLAQLLIKVAAPGVPDFYQGAELWNFRLVDPDNRRPVDFSLRAGILEELRSREAEGPLPLIQELLSSWEDGRIKLFVTYKALNFRKSNRELFLNGSYIPMRTSGEKGESLCAFGRSKDNAWAVVVVPRWLTKLKAPGKVPVGRRVWGGTGLLLPKEAPGYWENVLTGQRVSASAENESERVLPIHNVFETLPLALLYGVE